MLSDAEYLFLEEENPKIYALLELIREWLEYLIEEWMNKESAWNTLFVVADWDGDNKVEELFDILDGIIRSSLPWLHRWIDDLKTKRQNLFNLFNSSL